MLGQLKLNFQPKQATREILSFLDKKPRDIIERRFGLGAVPPKTLESIGRDYNITRERVRQIEEDSMRRLKKSENFSKLDDVFNELKNKIDMLGGIVQEKEFLNSIAGQSPTRHHIRFLLVLGDDFSHLKEDKEFHHRLTIDSGRAEIIHESLRRLHRELLDESLLPEKEILSRFFEYVKSAVGQSTGKNIFQFLVKISRLIDSNPLGEWGPVSSPNIRPRGMRDLAFLAMRRHGSPMHFSETAKAISEVFFRNVNTQTVHNELIKDERFVLVGRGLYALKEWGYESGIVRDVIKKILISFGPMSKEDIIKTVMKERYVKENTILINLQNGKHFKKNADGAYIALN